MSSSPLLSLMSPLNWHDIPHPFRNISWDFDGGFTLAQTSGHLIRISKVVYVQFLVDSNEILFPRWLFILFATISGCNSGYLQFKHDNFWGVHSVPPFPFPCGGETIQATHCLIPLCRAHWAPLFKKWFRFFVCRWKWDIIHCYRLL